MKKMYVTGESSRLFRRRKNWKKIAIISLLVLISILIIILAAIPPLMMNSVVNLHVNFNKMYSPEDFGVKSDRLTLKTSDGFNIAAYEVHTPNPKAVVIFISGIHNPSVTAFYSHSKFLAENDYASILMEMRAHGESDGDVISLGYTEYLDTQAVVDYIKGQSKYNNTPIVVYGLSMGGATAINSIGKIPAIDGLISMSAYSSWEDAFYDNMVNMGFPKFFAAAQKPFIGLYNTLKYGLSSRGISPKQQVKNLGERPALIMHSTQDSQVPYPSFERIIKAAPSHVETWVREGDIHFMALDNNLLEPEKDQEYMNKVMTFLEKHFGR